MASSQVKLSPESVERVRASLIEKILEDRASSGMSGPNAWDLLLHEGVTWKSAVHLDPNLLQELQPEFSPSVTREVLLAAAGIKLSRTCLADDKVATLERIAARYNFELCVSEERYIHRPDAGKGGSSNQIACVAEAANNEGLRNVYVASDGGLAEAGKMLEEAGDDEIFGTLLGIPRCCRNAFAENLSVASAKQTDFVLVSLENTPGDMPYDSWLNYPANYFGGGLISFFPCSYRCERAALVARSTFAALNECGDRWARGFPACLRTNILYTEYDGLHMFAQPLMNGVIRYTQADLRTTMEGPLTELLRRGTQLRVYGKRHVAVFREGEQIGELSGPDIGLCCFF